MIAKQLKPLVFLGAVVLTGCATSSAPPPSAKGPPQGSSAANFDAGLASQASAFEAYTRRAAAIDPSFATPGEISQALRVGAGYEPRQLEAGMIAYAAMAAMQEPKFIETVRRGGRDLGRRLAANPGAAVDLPGGPAAAARANAALARRGEALANAGLRVKKASYSVQREAAWSKTRINNSAQLSVAKSSAGYRPEAGDRASLSAAIADGGRRGGASPVIDRGLTVAALTVLGQDGQARSMMNEPRSGGCLRTAKLMFHQCLAAAGTHYENIYCLGLHAMADPGQCVVDATRPARSVRRASLD
jgi:hypothetical protein